MGRDLATVMQASEEERKKLKDDYLSVEHFMLGALDKAGSVELYDADEVPDEWLVATIGGVERLFK